MDATTKEWIRSLGAMLDGLHVALCLFDGEDNTLAWNRTFFKFFPEHEGHLHAGEPYRDNLRRFYQARLQGDECAEIERYIDAGIARHRAQAQPYEFEHRGLRLLVSSLPLEGVGRMRLWRAEKALATPTLDAALQALAGQQAAAPLAPLLDRLPNGLMAMAPDGRISWVNETFAQMYGLRNPAAAVGATLEAVYRTAWGEPTPQTAPAPCAEGLRTLHENLRFTGAPFELPLPGRRFCRVMARPAPDGARFYAHIDISELRHQQQRLEQAERAARESAQRLAHESALLQATLESMEQGIALVGADGTVEYFNDRVVELLHMPRALLESRPRLEDVIEFQRARGDFDGVSCEVENYLRSDPHAYAGRVVQRKTPGGQVIEVRSYSVPGGGVVRTYADVTERLQHQERIQFMASHDGLTGLLNRGKFMECLAAELRLARRMRTRLGVLYLDLDGFKPVNDRHGHAMGDKVLAWVAQTLGQVARESDFVARMGGDEFAVLQRGVEEHAQVRRLAERLAHALSQPFVVDGHALRIGASVGLALYPDHGADPEALMVHADQAMYLAKASQREGGSLLAPRSQGTPP